MHSKEQIQVVSGRHSYSWAGARWWWEAVGWPSSLRNCRQAGNVSWGADQVLAGCLGEDVTKVLPSMQSAVSQWQHLSTQVANGLGLIGRKVTAVSSGCLCCSLLWNVLLWPPSCVCMWERNSTVQMGCKGKVLLIVPKDAVVNPWLFGWEPQDRNTKVCAARGYVSED